MANETIRFSLAALANIQETSANISGDIAALRSGAHTPESLLAHCLNGAGKDRLQGWFDYVVELVAVSAIPPFIPTHEITTDGKKLLVLCNDGDFFSEAEWGAQGEPSWGLDEYYDLVFRGGTPPSGSHYRELSKLEPHFVVVDEPNDGAFTLGQFIIVNADSPPSIDEIVRMGLIEIGSEISFDGGAVAMMTIRRVR